MVFGIFKFCLGFELFRNIKKIPGLYIIAKTNFFYIFINNWRPKQNKKISNILL